MCREVSSALLVGGSWASLRSFSTRLPKGSAPLHSPQQQQQQQKHQMRLTLKIIWHLARVLADLVEGSREGSLTFDVGTSTVRLMRHGCRGTE